MINVEKLIEKAESLDIMLGHIDLAQLLDLYQYFIDNKLCDEKDALRNAIECLKSQISDAIQFELDRIANILERMYEK